jgi:outer membrane protein OmpA-like peptidoglycan-associated protein
MTRYFIKISILTMTCQFTYAGDVQMFTTPPSAEEMGRILFSTESATSNESTEEDSNDNSEVKNRSISFRKKTNESAAKKAPKQASNSSDNAFGLPIEFAYNSSQISDSSIPFLTEIGKMLSSPDFSTRNLVIEGHTDAVGSDDYNRYLSKTRAESIKNYLIENYQIQSSRLVIKGLGESEPLQGTDPSDGVNRRVQFRSAN